MSDGLGVLLAVEQGVPWRERPPGLDVTRGLSLFVLRPNSSPDRDNSVRRELTSSSYEQDRKIVRRR